MQCRCLIKEIRSKIPFYLSFFLVYFQVIVEPNTSLTSVTHKIDAKVTSNREAFRFVLHFVQIYRSIHFIPKI